VGELEVAGRRMGAQLRNRYNCLAVIVARERIAIPNFDTGRRRPPLMRQYHAAGTVVRCYCYTLAAVAAIGGAEVVSRCPKIS
jgi:hypothetical protein